MSTANPMQGNSQPGQVFWEPLDIPKRTIRARKLAAFGRRLSKLLRLGNLSQRLQSDRKYHQYLGM